MKTRTKTTARLHSITGFKTFVALLFILLMYANGRSQIDISNFEPAAVVETRHVYNSFSYGAYFISFMGTGHFTNLAAYGIGYGVAKQFELKLSYSLLHGEWTDFLHLIQITPKYSSKSGVFGIKGIFGLYLRNVKEWQGDKNFETAFRFSPRILITPVSSRYFDLTFSPMLDFYFEEGYTLSYMGLNMGFGFSSNMNVWSLRPELGFMYNISKDRGRGILWSPGLGIRFNF